MIDNKKEILNLKAFSIKSYSDLDLDRLTVYALSVLEQKNIPLYFDYVAVALFRLFPKKFSMANFSKYPDTFRINNSIRRLAGGLGAKSSKAGWATGSVENGFKMTNVGKEIAAQMEIFLKSPHTKKRVKPTASKTRGRFSSDDVLEIRSSDAYKKWTSKEPINVHEFLAFLKAAPYTPKHLLSSHLARLKDSANTAGDKEVLEFLQWMEEKFSSLLN